MIRYLQHFLLSHQYSTIGQPGPIFCNLKLILSAFLVLNVIILNDVPTFEEESLEFHLVRVYESEVEWEMFHQLVKSGRVGVYLE